MSMRRTATIVIIGLASSIAQAQDFGIGTPATEAEIAGWSIDVSPSGEGLPLGKGSVVEGAELFASRCAVCHGSKALGKAEDAIADRLVGGIGSLASDKPVKTVGSFWPYATTLYDYIHRAMPYDAPQSLQPGEVYALSAYILFLNGIVDENTVLDAKSLPNVKMPNHGNFRPDPRPDTSNVPCIADCN
jgi:cytochrome c